ncbi:MAG: Ldh family oxidoreductase [Candidatus Caldatribacteriota bacterium]
MSENKLIDGEKLKSFIRDIFLSVGVVEEDATITSNSLVEADLRGVYSHGVIRVPIYIKRIKLGLVNPISKIEIINDNKAVAVLDANNCLGQVSSTRAMNMALEKADKYSIGAVVVRNSNHFGTAAGYTLLAVEKDMIGYATTNSACRMVPTGGKDQIIGNNPFSYAIPAGKFLPIVLDLSCSVVSLGKILLKKKKGEALPSGWALDKEGNPTNDPYIVLEDGGSLVPIGEHKGYGMALINDILSSSLGDSIGGTQVTTLYDLTTAKKSNTGHFFMALKIDNFIPINRFKQRVDTKIWEIKNSAKREGVEQIYLPGEIEFKTKEENLEYGIPINEEVLKDLKSIADENGINMENYQLFR